MNLPEHLILFDGVCNLCTTSVQFVIKRDKQSEFYFASLQSETGQKILKQNNLPVSDFHSFIYLRRGRLFMRSDAALQLVGDLNGCWRLLKVFLIIPRFIRNGVYNLIAKNRFRLFGKKDSCLVPTPELQNRFLK